MASESSVAIFQNIESNVRSYCRGFPKVFSHAKNATVTAETGESYIDFFAGAGALNYGHNPDFIKRELISFLESDALNHGLDLYTPAKRTFLEAFHEMQLAPKGLDYRVQFPGPTGTNAVEAALKIARKATGRTQVFAFMGGYHGMTQAALACTGNSYHRDGSGLPLTHTTFIPFPGMFEGLDVLAYMERILSDTHSGIDKPAAVIIEPIQAEGGVNVASVEFLQGLRALCDKHQILLIADEIQVGCGRTGPFFAFESAEIKPDIVTLSKSISGYGLPMSLVLLREDLDLWQPAEHNGTFRGNQMAFIAGAAALKFREEQALGAAVQEKGRLVVNYLEDHVCSQDDRIELRGAGLIWGIDLSGLGNDDIAARVGRLCFERGLIVERAGRNDQVIKILPPLTIETDLLKKGCEIISESLRDALAEQA